MLLLQPPPLPPPLPPPPQPPPPCYSSNPNSVSLQTRRWTTLRSTFAIASIVTCAQRVVLGQWLYYFKFRISSLPLKTTYELLKENLHRWLVDHYGRCLELPFTELSASWLVKPEFICTSVCPNLFF
jgi:hypothetical protein